MHAKWFLQFTVLNTREQGVCFLHTDQKKNKKSNSKHNHYLMHGKMCGADNFSPPLQRWEQRKRRVNKWLSNVTALVKILQPLVFLTLLKRLLYLQATRTSQDQQKHTSRNSVPSRQGGSHVFRQCSTKGHKQLHPQADWAALQPHVKRLQSAVNVNSLLQKITGRRISLGYICSSCFYEKQCRSL